MLLGHMPFDDEAKNDQWALGVRLWLQQPLIIAWNLHFITGCKMRTDILISSFLPHVSWNTARKKIPS